LAACLTTKAVVLGSLQAEHVSVQELSKLDSLSGKLQFQSMDDKLMHSVMENDSQTIDQGKLLSEAMNMSLSSFTPDMMFQQMVNNYQLAKQIYGEKLIRQISGYDPDYVQDNIKVPEFQRIIKNNMKQNVEQMKRSKLLNRDSSITDKGMMLASLVMYAEELDRMKPDGFLGKKENQKRFVYGEKQDLKLFSKSARYRDIAIKKSIKLAARRGHSELMLEDLKVYERSARGQCHLIYALDASGSMKGTKIGSCKKAGIALAYRAIEEKDKVGLIIFGKEVIKAIPPTDDFMLLLKEITTVRASQETDIAATIRKSVELFTGENVTKHLILLTDAVPTAGDEPEKETLEAVSDARAHGITISIVGINLDEKGKKLGEQIVEIGQGRFYVAGSGPGGSEEDIDAVVLEDYYSM
jgi:Mg-chelatase subunit ChlD